MPSDAVICACVNATAAILIRTTSAEKPVAAGALAENATIILDALIATCPDTSTPDHHRAVPEPEPEPDPHAARAPQPANCPESNYQLARGVFEGYTLAQIWQMSKDDVRAEGIKKYSQSGQDYVRWMASSQHDYAPWRSKARKFLQAQGEELPE